MSDQIYSARYSAVDVYELLHSTGSVMKRKNDGWVNATHILKAANFAKAKRTRILDKEVLKGVHEKVQGGFGKYQGTWVPLDVAISLAEKFNVYEELKPLFDYVQREGEEAPPPAPKHHHASRVDGKKKATKSASMPAIVDKPMTLRKKPNKNSNTSTATAGSLNQSLSSSQNTSSNDQSASTVIKPVVTRRRGRPPLSSKANRKLATGLSRSQSDIGLSNPGIPNSTMSLPPLPPLRATQTTLEPLQHNNNNNNVVNDNRLHSSMHLDAKLTPHYKELDIDDGLSSDIEPSTIRDNSMHHMPSSQIQTQSNQLNSSGTSSPSLPTSPDALSETNPFDSQRFGGIGTSPIVSTIPRYASQNRPQSSDINDKVNGYLSNLVDYFISNEMKENKEIPHELLTPPPQSAPYIDVPIDPELHTAFHWACSMGNLPIVEALFQVGTSPKSVNAMGQTPLMRAAMFHNSYTKRTFPRIFQLLHDTVFDVDTNLQTVIHHIVKRKSTTPSAVYYLDILLSKIKDFAPPYRIEHLLNTQDSQGDTALHIAARNGDKAFFHTLISDGALSTIPNKERFTPNELMNQHYEQHLSTIKNSTGNIDQSSQKDFLIEDTLMSPSDFIMYPSQAATRISRAVPNIAGSMKEIAERYNAVFQNREHEMKNLGKTIKSITINVNNVNSRIFEELNDDDGTPNEKSNVTTDMVGKLFDMQRNKITQTHKKVIKLKHNLKNRYEKTQINRIQSYLDHDEGRTNIGNGNFNDLEHRVNLSIEITKFQLRRRRLLQNVFSVLEDNKNIHKYRKMISEATEMHPEEIDDCLNIILESLENNQNTNNNDFNETETTPRDGTNSNENNA